MVINYILFGVGIFLLIKGADFIIESSSSLAKKLGISNIIIGLTVVSFGTTLPELVVNLFALSKGSSEIIFGNVIGSVISNVLLILGITTLITNVKVRTRTVWKEIPFALLACFVLFALTSKVFFDSSGYLRWNDGLILIALLAMFIYYVYQSAVEERKRIPLVEEPDISGWKIGIKLIIGLAGIYFGGRWVVNGAVFMAQQLGLSEFLISATIVAVGTSLPELVVAIVAAFRKNVDLAVGNIIGSNILNILWVLGIASIIKPIVIPQFIYIDIAIMFGTMFLLFLFMFIGKKRKHYVLNKKDGIAFVLFYVLYVVYLISRG